MQEKSKKRKGSAKNYFSQTWQLYAMLILPIAYFIIFKYWPILNTRIAFKDYNLFLPISENPWNHFAHFKEVFSQQRFYIALRNTLMLNFLDLIIGFPIPIIIALCLNELASSGLKKVTQTIIYIPHFLSWVVIAGIALQIFSNTGIVNTIITNAGGSAVNFLGEKSKWLAIYVGAGVWQGAGYGTIIYLAALSGVDPTLYEAAYVDGAGRFRRVISITLPCIKGTIVTMLILQAGKLISISFDRPNMMGNPLVSEYSEVISTYVYSVGLQGLRYDYATAVGVFQSVVAFVLLVTVNAITKKMGEEGIM